MAAGTADQARRLLLELYRAALAAVEGRRRVRAALAAGPGPDPVHAVAIGKAAASMMLGATDALGERLQRGLVVGPDGSIARELAARPGMWCLEAGHPLPDERSLAAGQALLEFAAATPPASHVLLMVSGGASALLEVPAPGVSLADLQRLYQDATAQGLDIEDLNARRRELSLVKGGRLPGLFAGSSVEGLLISDVPRDDPAVIGSGLLAAPGCRLTLVGCLDDALEAILRAARAQGLSARRVMGRLDGEAETAARSFCHELAIGEADLQVAGGETVVRLPAEPGRGGRCQQFALAAAQSIAGHAEFIVLAAGSDGRDGASEDAGAIVDGETVQRALDAGFDVATCLGAADSGTALEAAGDLVYTGATGTNVGDIVLGLRLPPAPLAGM
jgi:hydroxypyruvate reductase